MSIDKKGLDVATIPDQTREVENLRPLFFAYRDNDLYKEMVPALIDKLRGLGYIVEAKMFPPTTDAEEIKQWAADHQIELADKQIISDDTFKNSIGYKLTGSFSLDGFAGAAPFKLLLGYNEGQPKPTSEKKTLEEKLEDAGKIMVRLVKNILNDPAHLPEHVYVDLNKIFDHLPTEFLPPGVDSDATVAQRDFMKKEYAKAVELYPDEAEFKEHVGELLAKLNAYVPPFENERAEGKKRAEALITDWLTTAGIPHDKISFIDLTKDDSPKEFGNNQSWLIADRHHLQTPNTGNKFLVRHHNRPWEPKKETGAVFKGKFFQLPPESFFKSAYHQGLITANPEDLVQVMADEMDGYLKKKK